MSMNVLVVDDEEDIRELVSDILIDAKFEVRTAPDSQKTFELINEKIPTAIILDIWLQGSELDGLGILEIVKKKYPMIPVIVISGHGTIATAVTAIRMGAFDYIEKPFTQEKLLIVLKRACESAKLKKENIQLKSKVIDKNEIIGNSPSILKIKSEIEKVAPSATRIVLQGPTGSGKELIAKIVHEKSKQCAGPFNVYNPTGILPNRIYNDFFSRTEKTILEKSNNGTLYIDEISNLPMNVQNKLLKFLQDPTIERNGKMIKLNIRIISSTSVDLNEQIKIDKFNQDLYYRISVASIDVPTLSERKEDIPLLVEYFASYISKSSGLKYRVFSGDSLIALQSYKWPGNIRQLKNVIEWCFIMNPILESDDGVIRSSMLPSEILNDSSTISRPENSAIDVMSMPLREAREVFERQYLAAQMSRFNNNISKTSVFVGMERSALHRKLKLLKIHNTNCDINEDSAEMSLAD
jgi:two-component system nitrogen regulation response regulator NtrX